MARFEDAFEGFRVSRVAFWHDEDLGLRLVTERATPVLDGAARRAAAKISSAPGEAQKESMVDTPLEAGPSRAATGDGNSLPFATVLAAIAVKELLTIGYQNSAGRSSTREARPLGLTLFEKAWLLTIRCQTTQDFRHRRLDRITFLKGTGNRFRTEKGKRFRTWLTLSAANSPFGRLIDSGRSSLNRRNGSDSTGRC